jgi:hypothetical protein
VVRPALLQVSAWSVEVRFPRGVVSCWGVVGEGFMLGGSGDLNWRPSAL